MRLLRGRLPLWLAIGVLLGSIAWTVRALLGITRKAWIYPIDDAYIHLALARTLVNHGVWGIDAAHPSTATSSPGWVILLAAARTVPGLGDIAPALLSLAGSLGILWFGDRVLVGAGSSMGVRALALAGIVVLTPLSVLSVLGMEHTLFIAAIVAWLAAVEYGTLEWPRGRIWDAALAAAIVWLRPEGALVMMAWGLTRFRNVRVRWSVAAGVVAGGAMAILQWLVAGSPLSIATLMKTAAVRAPGTSVATEVLRLVWLRVYSEPWILVLWLFLAVLVAGASREGRDPKSQWPRALVLLLPLHVVCSEVGSGFGRYDGYLVVLAALASAVAARALTSWAVIPATVCASLLLWPLAARPGTLQEAMLRDMHTLYAVHWQLAQFVRDSPFVAATTVEHRGRHAVVADDIGLIAYYGEVPIVDVVGQATPAVARARRAGTYNVRTLEAEAQASGAKLAIVSQGWFEEPFGTPAEWVHLADLTAPASGDRYTLTIWAMTLEDAPALRAALRAFAVNLPAQSQLIWHSYAGSRD